MLSAQSELSPDHVYSSVLLPWYGIRTKSNQDKLASTILTNKGYESFLPSYSYHRKRWDRTVESERPLFPGYLFCRFDVKQRLPILITPGVVSVLGFGNEPLPIPETEIEAIRTALRSGRPVEPFPYLQEGERIQVTRGALEGLQGILVQNKSDWRLVISVTMLQRSVSVEIDRDAVAALKLPIRS